MKKVRATELKNRLGEALRHAAFAPVAIERHGKVVAYLVPANQGQQPATGRAGSRSRRAAQGRVEEDRLVDLCASGDFRPSRWRRAGNARDLAGAAVMLASTRGFERPRMLALAEALHPGMSSGNEFERWLAEGRIDPSRFLPMVRMRRT